MSPTRHPDDDLLDTVLRASAPPTPGVDARTDRELAELVADARRAARPGRSRRTKRHVVAASAAILFGLAGASTAAATVSGVDWLPWAEDPDAIFTYTLPSGAVCEERIGEVSAADARITEATREYFRNNDVLALVDVDAMIAQMRTEDDTPAGAGGVELPAAYPDEQPMPADLEYSLALQRAVGGLVSAELERQGFDLDAAEVGWGGQASCPGADW
jgi:hypothetical protein